MPSIGDNPKLKIFSRVDILKARADALVIPQNTDGQVAMNFRPFIEQLGFYPENDTPLGEIDPRGDIKNSIPFKYVVYAAADSNTGNNFAAIREIAIKLGKFAEITPDIQIIACTVFGTGNGDLNGLDCVKIIAKAFLETSSKELNIYTNDEALLDSADHINISEFEGTPSLRYAFRASVIKSVRHVSLQPILNSTDFYYQLAKDKFEEYLSYRAGNITFFEQLAENFKHAWGSKGVTFLSVLAKFEPESDDHIFLKLCGELVAYIDLNAANKNEWNHYPDKRVIAKANVRQFEWIGNLLQFRIDDNPGRVAENVTNAIKFLQEPAHRLSMLSNRHRAMLLKNIYGNTYENEAELDIIFNQFELWGIKANNPVNTGTLFTRILYLDDVEILWNQAINETIGENDNKIFPGTLESVGEPVTTGQRSIEPVFLTDYYAEVDLLNYELYAAAIVAFIKHKNTRAPLTIGIMAPWGKGKTSLMHFIKLKLDGIKPLSPPAGTTAAEEPGIKTATFRIFRKWLNSAKRQFVYEKTLQYPTVWFNAWKFQKTEQIWAGFAYEIIHQLVGQLPNQLAREEFWLRLNLKRIDQEKLRNKLFFKIINKIIKSVTCIVLGGLSILFSLIFHPALLLGLILYGVLPVASAIYFAVSRYKVEKEKIDLDIEKFVKQPDYAAKRGYFHEVEDDLKDVMNILISDHKPAVIFIDDLDRCSPNTVAEVVEAINLFVSGDFPKCYFILGQDAQMVAASLDVAYGKIADNSANLYREQGSLGWHFMEKFVQLQFCIPALNEEQAKTFFKTFFKRDSGTTRNSSELNNRLTELENKIESDEPINNILTSETLELEETLKAVDPLKAVQLQEKIIEKAASEYDDNEPEILDLIDKLGGFVGTSPRAIKRFINLYRFYKFLQLTNRNTRLQETSSAHLGQWLVVMIRWPQLVRAIQWQANDDFIKGSNALERSKSFENMLFKYANYIEWTEVVDNNAPKLTWLKDLELYQFIHFIKKDKNSLDNAVLMGLW